MLPNKLIGEAINAPYIPTEIVYSYDHQKSTLLQRTKLKAVTDGPDGETLATPVLEKYQPKYRLPRFPKNLRSYSTVYVPCTICNWIRANLIKVNWKSVEWSDDLNLYCVVGSQVFSSGVRLSTNGQTWTAPLSGVPTRGGWNSVVWSHYRGIFVAVGDYDVPTLRTKNVMISSDGYNWSSQKIGDQDITSVCWSPMLSIFCATTRDADYAGKVGHSYTSPDGVTWTDHAFPEEQNPDWSKICWSQELGMFIILDNSSSDGIFMRSYNGADWFEVYTPGAGVVWTDVCWSQQSNRFCAVGNNAAGGVTMISSDGIHWRVTATVNGNLASIAWSPSQLRFVAPRSFTNTTPDDVIYSRDGVYWSACNLPVSAGTPVGKNSLSTICWSDGRQEFLTTGFGKDSINQSPVFLSG